MHCSLYLCRKIRERFKAYLGTREREIMTRDFKPQRDVEREREKELRDRRRTTPTPGPKSRAIPFFLERETNVIKKRQEDEEQEERSNNSSSHSHGGTVV